MTRTLTAPARRPLFGPPGGVMISVSPPPPPHDAVIVKRQAAVAAMEKETDGTRECREKRIEGFSLAMDGGACGPAEPHPAILARDESPRGKLLAEASEDDF